MSNIIINKKLVVYWFYNRFLVKVDSEHLIIKKTKFIGTYISMKGFDTVEKTQIEREREKTSGL